MGFQGKVALVTGAGAAVQEPHSGCAKVELGKLAGDSLEADHQLGRERLLLLAEDTVEGTRPQQGVLLAQLADEESEPEETEGGWYAADSLSFDYDPKDARQPLYPFQRRVLKSLHKEAYPPKRGRKLVMPIATGGGKTRVANDWIWTEALPRNKRVLWVTKDWELLRQAASDLCRRFEGAPERIGRLGGKSHLDELEETLDADVVYTTIHTWYKRRNKAGLKKKQRFDYVVIDEVHWGEGGTLYGALDEQYGDRATFVGLTATPREWTDYEPVCEGLGFRALVDMGFLSKPKFKEVHTRFRWNPERAGDFGDFTGSSLRVLATSDKRNRKIVDTYREHPYRYGKTLVFACDIDHAEELARQFQKRGVAAEAIHSKLGHPKRRELIHRFRGIGDGAGEPLDVLVNIAMMTHGVDIPDIRTIFLARPTASKVLFSQMVGRGARIIPGEKEKFWVVDFVDNLEAHADVLVRSGQVYDT
jgi:ATP-dependent helicase IRC3